MDSPSYVRYESTEEIGHNEGSPIEHRDFPTEHVHTQVCINDRTETQCRLDGKQHGYDCQRECPRQSPRTWAHEPKKYGIAEPMEQVGMEEMACKVVYAIGKYPSSVCYRRFGKDGCAKHETYKRNIKRRIFSCWHSLDILRMMMPATLGSSPKHGAGCMITSSTARVSGISGCSRL